MIANRPLIYLTLPSLALIIGYVWLRRKKGGKAVCDSGGGEVEPSRRSFVSPNDKNCKIVDSSEFKDQLEVYSSSAHTNSQHSESLPIGKLSQKNHHQQQHRSDSQSSSLSDQEQQKSQSPHSAGSNSSLSSISKSAPIDIAPNPRSPPKRVTEQDVDSEILKLIPQESDIKNLRYIEEIDWNESPTPADSPLYRDRYDLNRGQPKVEPTVYVRGTQEAKISPENSFRERKYTQTESDEYDTETTSNNNQKACSSIEASKMTEVVENIVSTETKLNTNTALTDSGCDAEVVATTDAKTTTVACSTPQISSPALSLCSMRSGDSGQGSSPPQSICSPQISYEFLIPSTHIGALIGPGGRIITDIKEKTGANVIIRKSSHNVSKKQRVCSVEGTQSEVDAALKLIRAKLPEKRYPNMTMERVFVTPDNRVAPMSMFNTSTLNVSPHPHDISLCHGH
jgi:A-kinase anchor protein 1, mitochondrial